MKFKKIEQKYLLRLYKGEEVVETLTKFCKDQNINFGLVSAIGGIHKITLGWYQLDTKQYHWKDFNGNLELVSLTGNISLVENEPFLHIHCVFSDETFQCFGGHLKKAEVGPTLEVTIEKLDGEVERKMDDQIGLKLLDL